MFAKHGDFIDIANKFSLGKESMTGTSSPEVLMRDKKSAT